VENSVKIARIATGRSAVIAFGGAFHGRTFMGMSLTGKVQPYKAGFGAMMPDVFHVPSRSSSTAPPPTTPLPASQALQGRPRPRPRRRDHPRARAGRGRLLPGPRRTHARLRRLCDDHGIVLIADEVQTGFARTGKLFAMEHYDVAPDLTCMAKGLGGGLPIAAVTGKASIMDAANPGGLGGTYGGNPSASPPPMPSST
jgi:4-aminobutyrate aminotransferase